MAFWLRSEERRVANRARRVRGDLSAVDASRRELTAGLREGLRRPKVLFAFFIAGLGFGWLRGARARSDRGDDGAGEREERGGGRMAKAVAAVVAGARIYEQLRQTAAFVDRQGWHAGPRGSAATSGERGSAPLRQHSPDPVQEHEGHHRH